jgi:hypothetical protein
MKVGQNLQLSLHPCALLVPNAHFSNLKKRSQNILFLFFISVPAERERERERERQTSSMKVAVKTFFSFPDRTRVARWFVFKPKIQI